MAREKRGGGRHPAGSNSTPMGRDYGVERARVPWGADLDHVVGNENDMTTYSPNGTTFDPEIKIIRDGYDRLWENK